MSDVNLKRVLMQLGNRLVTERGFTPSVGMYPSQQLRDAARGRRKHTTIIALFTAWVNESPEAREILAELGFEWPVAAEVPNGQIGG